MNYNSTNNNNLINYYTLLNINYNDDLNKIKDICINKINHYKSLPFLTENDKIIYKNYKSAYFIFNNPKYKKIYDDNIKKTDRKQNFINQSYIFDRIFSLPTNNTNYNLEHNHSLRPKNVGLIADDIPGIDIPLNFTNTNDFEPVSNDNNNYSEL